MKTEENIEDTLLKEVKIEASYSSFIPNYRYTSLLRFCDNVKDVFEDTRNVFYPKNETDQTHALSLAQQIRRGQIDGTMIDDSETSNAEVFDSVLPFYNREEFAVEEHNFKERMSKEYSKQQAQRREDALKQSEANKAQTDNFKNSDSAENVADSE